MANDRWPINTSSRSSVIGHRSWPSAIGHYGSELLMPRVRPGVVLLAIAGWFLVLGGPLAAQTTPTNEADGAAQAKAKAKTAKRARRDPPGFYMGRRIADVMSFAGADWLIRETREQEEQPEKMLDALKIPEGATVADVG